MPVSQPPITPDDPVRSSWDLEITQLVNRLEQQLQNLQVPDTSVVQDVDESGILNLNDGTLSSDPVVTSLNGQSGAVVLTPTGQAVSLNINNYPMQTTNAIGYSYPPDMFEDGDLMLDANNQMMIPPDRHQVFLGGLKLIESTTTVDRDYRISGTTINLQPDTMQRAHIAGLVLELVIFRI